VYCLLLYGRGILCSHPTREMTVYLLLCTFVSSWSQADTSFRVATVPVNELWTGLVCGAEQNLYCKADCISTSYEIPLSLLRNINIFITASQVPINGAYHDTAESNRLIIKPLRFTLILFSQGRLGRKN
jgi:hypothetical protein